MGWIILGICEMIMMAEKPLCRILTMAEIGLNDNLA